MSGKKAKNLNETYTELFFHTNLSCFVYVLHKRYQEKIEKISAWKNLSSIPSAFDNVKPL